MYKIEEFKEFYKRIMLIGQASDLMFFDLRTKLPKKGTAGRSEAMGELQTYAFELFTSEQMKNYLDYFSQDDIYNALNETDKAIVTVTKRAYEKEFKLPTEFVKRRSIVTSKGISFWKEAKAKNDFSIFEPVLQEIVEVEKEMADYYGYSKNRYDALIDDFDHHVSADQLKDVIDGLRKELVPFVKEAAEKSKSIDTSFLDGEYSVEAQKALSEKIIRLFNYDTDAGYIEESEHPFSIKIGPGDVRITTHYYTHNLHALFSTMHECGHGLYMFGIPEDIQNTILETDLSMAVHESQSRFWENIIGMSYGFWKYFYPEFQKAMPRFKDISLNKFYKAINTVSPCPIRIESDEATYNFHIMLRFELEEGLLNDRFKVKDLPGIWNEKMREYLGITPPNDSKGILQDIHWSKGNFGYFPSYMLGNLYSAQFYNKMKNEIPDLEKEIENGNFILPLNWLRNNVHVHGAKYTPDKLLEKVTGEPLNSGYFVDYIKNKYTKMFEL